MRQMGSGINIGNSLDAHGAQKYHPDATVTDFETFWGNPPISEALLQSLYNKGVRTIRIPVSWADHLDADSNIDPLWMKRVTQVVDQALDIGFYVILNTHHEDWIVPTQEQQFQVTQRLCRIWSQIAVQFADRDTHLLFESMNEPRLVGTPYEWTSGTAESCAIVNQLNAAFVKTVRISGGWNESRWLLLPAYASRYQEQALEAMELPEDPYLIVSVHAYIPYSFVTGETNWTSYDSSDTQRIDQMMASLYRVFLRKKIPVIITEFGCQVSVDFDQQLDWTQYYVSAAQKRGVPCLWWDDGKKYKLINRETLEWEYPEIANILLNQCVTE